MDYESMQKASAEPLASSMIETFRAIGYSLETAVADIIDNSISANARNIWIDRIWRGGKSVIVIKDDGKGMSGEEIIKAMRPGSQNPLTQRSEKDLGRFGLGLKTASFSQCRKLTVLSKKTGYGTAFWTWDLDFVADSDKWELIKWIPEEFLSILSSMDSGTAIIWSDLDRIIKPNVSESDENAKIKFSNALDKVKNHIAMTFHRFMESKTLNIYWGSHKIEPWNPFCLSEKKIQSFSTECIRGGVTVKGYVLPHQNNFSSEAAYKRAEGMNGWSAHQGFYVYRGGRLLLAGDWLGIFRREEQYRLVRIQIDLPNTLDSEWQIDIKKSRAYPPASCREQLEAYARQVRNAGADVYRHRGKILKQRAGTSFQPLWLEKKTDSRWSFVVNRESQIVLTAKTMAKKNPEEAIEILLRYIEESIPTPSIFIREAEDGEKPKEPYSDIDEELIKSMLTRVYKNMTDEGLTPEQAKNRLYSIEPFNRYEPLIQAL